MPCFDISYILIQRASKNRRGPDLSRTLETAFSGIFLYLRKLRTQTPDKPEDRLIFSLPLHPLLFLPLQDPPLPRTTLLHPFLSTNTHLRNLNWSPQACSVYPDVSDGTSCFPQGHRLGHKQFAYCEADLAQEPCSGTASPRVGEGECGRLEVSDIPRCLL